MNIMWKLVKLAWAIRCLGAVLFLSASVAGSDPAGRIYSIIEPWPVSAAARRQLLA